MARAEPTTKRRRHEWDELRVGMVPEPKSGYVAYDPGDVLVVVREVSDSARVAVVEPEPGFERLDGCLRQKLPRPCPPCDRQMSEAWWLTKLGDAVLEVGVGNGKLKREKNPSTLFGVRKDEPPSEVLMTVKLKMRQH